jgi:protocatechuate 3,4-dioxygenase beta subunit
VIVANADGSFSVFGSHTYTQGGTGLTFKVTVADVGGASASNSASINVFALGQISGTVLLDKDGNGFTNTAPYTGPAATIDLYLNGGKVASTTTDSKGNYAFSGLHGARTYTVKEEVPAGYTLTAQTGNNIVSLSGFNSTGNNFADFPARSGQISGTLFLDPTGKGFKNKVAYTGPAATIDLYLNGNKVASTPTDSKGNYAFVGLAGPGTYTVQEEVPAGYFLTAQSGARIMAKSGLKSTGNNFADFQNGSISGTVVADPDGNGFQNQAAYAGPAVTIDLYLGNKKVASTTTDSEGNYSFSGLHGAGTYTVKEEVPAGYTLTAQVGKSIVSANGFVSLANNFADYQDSTISGVVFNDKSDNHVQDLPGDVGLKGVVIQFDGKKAATTDANGKYTIVNVGPGKHTVTQVLSTYLATFPAGDSYQIPAQPANFSITGENFGDVVIAYSLDNTSPGFSTLGSGWTTVKTGWNGSSATHVATASPNVTATWKFNLKGLTTAIYEVFITYVPSSTADQAASYQIFDGSHLDATVT